jgi:hypothetical protein
MPATSRQSSRIDRRSRWGRRARIGRYRLEQQRRDDCQRARLNSYFKEVALLEQPFVKDNKTTIKQVLAQAGVTVTGFARFQVGQA